MGFWSQSWWPVMVGLIFCCVCLDGCSADAQSRQRRQQQWRNRQPGLGSSRGASVLGSQSRRNGWGSVSGWDNSPRYSSEMSNLRQMPSQWSPVTVQCNEDNMRLAVRRDLFGNGKLVKASDLSLGAQSCTPGVQNQEEVVYFEIGLHECGNLVQMSTDLLSYSTTLNYNPTANRNSPIIRTNSATVNVQCNYPRHGNVSSNAVKPTWIPFSSTITSEERLSFSLVLMTEDWSAPRSDLIFSLGEMLYIEASLVTANHVDMFLFVDSCVATLSSDVSSSPRYEIISSYGCMMDGKQEDSSSAFRSPRSQPNKLQFMVDAFRFKDHDLQTIFITCTLRAALASQTPDPENKACSFAKTRNMWTPLEGPSNICTCCDTGVCARPGSRRLDDHRSRRIGKRTTEAKTEQATLGPLYLMNYNPYRTLVPQKEVRDVAVGHWPLLTAVCLVSVALSVCLAVIANYLCKRNRQSNK